MNREQLTQANQAAAGLDKVYKDQLCIKDIKGISVRGLEAHAADTSVFELKDYPQLFEKVVKLIQAEIPLYLKTITKKFESL